MGNVIFKYIFVCWSRTFKLRLNGTLVSVCNQSAKDLLHISDEDQEIGMSQDGI